MQYTRQVQYLHSQLAPTVPIDSFIDAIKPAALGLTDKSQFYAPVRFAVQICGGINAAAGAIRVDVPIHANERWLDDMKKRFAGMIGLKNSLQGSDISFRTVAGQDISTIDQQHLPRVGKLNVYVGDKKIRLPAMPAIPVEYSVCKEANIQAWLQQVSAELPDLIAHELVAQKNLTQLDAAVRGDGPVLKLIQKHLLSSAAPGGGGWNEFLRTHHMNSPDRISSSEAQSTLVSVSKDMLSNLRRFIEASAEPIGSYISHLDAKRIASDLSKRSEQDVDHYKPLLAAVPGGAGNGNIDGHELYRKIAEDALASPFVQQAIIATVYTRPIESGGCRWSFEDEKKLRRADDKKKANATVEIAQEKVAKATKAADAAAKAAASETNPRKKAALQAETNRLAAEKRAAEQAAAEAAASMQRQQAEAMRKAQEEAAEAKKQVSKKSDAVPAQVDNNYDDTRDRVDKRLRSALDDEKDTVDILDKFIEEQLEPLDGNDADNLFRDITISFALNPDEYELADEVGEDEDETLEKFKLLVDDIVAFRETQIADKADTGVRTVGDVSMIKKLPVAEKKRIVGFINQLIDSKDQITFLKQGFKEPNIFTKEKSVARYNAFEKYFGIKKFASTAAAVRPEKRLAHVLEVVKDTKLDFTTFEKIKDADINAQIGAHHPWNAQIHHTLQPLADGAYPTYYNLLHTQQNMSKNAAFAGDVVETYKAYHMFSGLPISPPGLLVEPIAKRAASGGGGGRRSKKKSGKWNDSSDDENKFHRMKSEMPPLIPLGDHVGLEPIQCGSCGGHSSDEDEPQNEKMMSMIRGNLPPLERIDCGMSSDEDDEVEKKKRIGSSIAPPVVPLNGMPKLVPLSAPATASAVAGGIPPRPPLIRLSDVQAKIRSRLVPISDDMQDIESSDSMANEDIGDAYNLPGCNDVFGPDF